MFIINGTLRLAKYFQLSNHVFLVRGEYLVERLKREEKGYVVCEAFNTKTKEKLDIVKFTDVFINHYELSVLRQIQVYKAMELNSQIRSLVDIMIPSRLIHPEEEQGTGKKTIISEEFDEFKDVYLVFKSMKDFEYLFAALAGGKEHTHDGDYQSYIWQLLSAVHHLHIAGIIHGNINPLAIAVSLDRKLIQLYNFDLCAPESIGEFHDEDEEDHETVISYTAPEVILGCSKYHHSADIWAVGCIFAQMLNRGIPVFALPSGIQPTRDNWLMQIMRIVKPTSKDMDFLRSEIVDKQHMLHLLSSSSRSIEGEEDDDKHLLDQLGDECSRDLLKSMLQFDPSKRLSAEEALHHRYFDGVLLPKKEDFDKDVSLDIDVVWEDLDEDAPLDIKADVVWDLRGKMGALDAAYTLQQQGIAPSDLNEEEIKEQIWKEMKSFKVLV